MENYEARERIAVLETKVDSLAIGHRETLERLDAIHDILLQTRGAGKLATWLVSFLGIGTAALVWAKWKTLLLWAGS